MCTIAIMICLPVIEMIYLHIGALTEPVICVFDAIVVPTAGKQSRPFQPSFQFGSQSTSVYTSGGNLGIFLTQIMFSNLQRTVNCNILILLFVLIVH